ncbi:hypothetical protein PHYBLDRAFT_140468 [Phycomyces blakesleeanus NRRL 1555(-)]|uniref:Uncharacterized protein n=1 Tax=Phycomyces blakesleeanus (strain ATCC 8743b / DSM 1359 / FGSC 10004 / NBRC 33097 / NRRL 1555) TaxID=763407 RepID=A0A163B5F0_PHYB8|nr:hypothetical protein PHYBLDRAFT_140468 [Phycomyces blakesleeanus NRRL 1555(-)]OAD78371.1 hypothetical protein PHYBLDRAFT_140468 [Phycomyces blakesleeanus NRRL 1555(-)]|eukprot:XP_018296411.1 hypothetical protein PHYBLDRAFT_140468 [Phycomyces blakesleeanus NRRL 1555(-)]
MTTNMTSSGLIVESVDLVVEKFKISDVIEIASTPNKDYATRGSTNLSKWYDFEIKSEENHPTSPELASLIWVADTSTDGHHSTNALSHKSGMDSKRMVAIYNKQETGRLGKDMTNSFSRSTKSKTLEIYGSKWKG